MNPSRRLAARLVLAAGVGALLFPATAGVASAQNATETSHRADTATSKVITCEGGTCEGTDEADTIVANNATQQVFGYGGDDDIELDAIFTSGSGDVAYGGEGRDCIDGGAGNDRMFGGPGDDNRPCEFTAFVDPQAALTGGPGDDTIFGGAGDDSMNGIFDDDTLFGGPGNDLLRDTSPGDKDRLFGGPGDDTLDARDGDGGDLIHGGPGDDDCSGDAGDRFMSCERIQRF
jgi:Ca2+-binding RTX toxin-like protein